jgi:NitT/TauT family transport system substrate-binding protein
MQQTNRHRAARWSVLLGAATITMTACGSGQGTASPAPTAVAPTTAVDTASSAPGSTAAEAAATTAPAPPVDPIKLSIGVLQANVLSFPFEVAEEQGMFHAAGLDVELVPAKSGPEMVAALIGGTTNLAGGAPQFTMSAMAQGQDLVVVGPQVRNDMKLLVRADRAAGAPTTYPEAIGVVKGMTIGVPALGGGAEQFVRLMLLDAGLSPDDVTFVATGATITAIPALQNGQVDALVGTSSTEASIDQAGIDVVTVADALTGTAGAFGDNGLTGFQMATGAFIDGNVDALSRYCTAMDRAIDWMQDPANRATAVAQLGTTLALPVAAAAKVLDAEKGAFSLRVDPTLWDKNVEYALPGKGLPYNTYVRPCPAT